MKAMIGAGTLALAFATGAAAQDQQAQQDQQASQDQQAQQAQQDPGAMSTTQQICADLNEMESADAEMFAQGYVQGFLAGSGDTLPTPQGNTTPPEDEGGEQSEVVDGVPNETDESGTQVGGAAVLRSSDLIEGCQDMADATLAEVASQHAESANGANNGQE